MDKKIRKAVRTFIVKDGKVLVIKYNLENNSGYFDIPGGKIEEGETPEEAAKRELKEETGLIANTLEFIGKCFIEYPDKIFNLDLYKVLDFEGSPENFEENDSMWLNISDLLKEEKILGTIKLLKYIIDENDNIINENIKINSNILCDENHNVEKIKIYKIREIETKDNKDVENVIRTCLIEFGGNHEGTAWTDPNLGRFSEIYNSEGNKYWVAEDETGKIVGGVGIRTLEGLENICELQKMYCLKEARGTKISHLLIEIALEYAKKYYDKCYLETLENMIAAQKFYEKYGFKRLEKPLLETGHFACDVCYLKIL